MALCPLCCPTLLPRTVPLSSKLAIHADKRVIAADGKHHVTNITSSQQKNREGNKKGRKPLKYVFFISASMFGSDLLKVNYCWLLGWTHQPRQKQKFMIQLLRKEQNFRCKDQRERMFILLFGPEEVNISAEVKVTSQQVSVRLTFFKCFASN